MSIGEPSESDSGRIDESQSMPIVSTGLDNLDEAITQKGIRAGSLLALVGAPDSVSEVVAANMISNRPAYYYSLGKSEAHIERNIEFIDNVNLDHVHLVSLPTDNPVNAFINALQEAEIPRGATVVVDPVNMIENMDTGTYREVLRTLEETVREVHGIGLLHTVSSNNEPDNRWFTKYYCDTVFEVMHRSDDEMVEDYLQIQKLYPGQSLADDDARVFELQHDLNMDVATSRNISP